VPVLSCTAATVDEYQKVCTVSEMKYTDHLYLNSISDPIVTQNVFTAH